MGSSPIRVLVVSTTLDVGGAQRVTSTLLEHFNRDRIAPSLCLLRHQVGFRIPMDVPVHQLGYRGTATFPLAVRGLRRLLRQHRPDVVLSNVNATNILTGWALRDRRITVPWVARFGNSPGLHDNSMRRWAARSVYPRATQLIANSRGLADEIGALYSFTRGRVAVLGNPTDFAAIDRQAGEASPIRHPKTGTVFIAVGRLARQKRYDVMLDAFARVQSQEACELWVCGDGPEAKTLRHQARALGVDEHVRWLGFVENPHAIMRQADVFLMTSDHEGLPNALIEAQGLGLPAVATRCPYGPDEIVEDGVTGLLVTPSDVDAIVVALGKVVSPDARRQQMGREAARRARARFDCRELTMEWEEMFLEYGATRQFES